MKKRNLIVSVTILLALVAAVSYLQFSGKFRFFASTVSPAPVRVVTNLPINVTETSASLQGEAIGVQANQNITVRGFQYGTSTSVYNTIYDVGNFSNGSFSKWIGFNGLEPNTTYYVRAFAGMYAIKDDTYAGDQTGNIYGGWRSFQTGGDGVSTAVIETILPKGIGPTEASFRGKVISTGGKTFVGSGFDYGTSKEKPTRITAASVFKESLTVTDLSPGVTYYVRAFAGEEGPEYVCVPGNPCKPFMSDDKLNTFGDWLTFSTPNPVLPPTSGEITTNPVVKVGSTEIIVSGTIVQTGAYKITGRGFSYRTAASQDPIMVKDESVPDGTAIGVGEYSQTISGLAPNTTYYVRAYMIADIPSSHDCEKQAGDGGCILSMGDPFTIGELITVKTAAIVTKTVEITAKGDYYFKSAPHFDVYADYGTSGAQKIGTKYVTKDYEIYKFTYEGNPQSIYIAYDISWLERAMYISNFELSDQSIKIGDPILHSKTLTGPISTTKEKNNKSGYLIYNLEY